MSTNQSGFWAKLVFMLAIFAVVIACYGYAVKLQIQSCEERGGHLEPIIGGRGSVCTGAER